MGIDLRAKTVGENIETDGLIVSGGIRLSSGGDSPVVDARWGQIQGTLANQTDLMAALNEKASASALTELGTEVAAKANKSLVVTFAQDSQTEQWSCDKTAQEVYEAYTDGQLVTAMISGRTQVFTLSLAEYDEEESIYSVVFVHSDPYAIEKLECVSIPSGSECFYYDTELADLSTVPYRVWFETDGSSYVTYDVFADVFDAYDNGREVYATLDGDKVYTLTIATDSRMVFSRFYLSGSSMVFEELSWELDDTTGDTFVYLTTKSLATWNGGSY